MKSISPHELDNLDATAAARLMLSRFAWLRRKQLPLFEWLNLQADISPRPNFYFRWHLPRIFATLELLETVIDRGRRESCLDIASYAPFAVCMERYFSGQLNPINWTRTSLTGEELELQVNNQLIKIPTVPLRLDGQTRFPFEDRSFDVVLITEVIEHLDSHPQYTLAEANRVLRDGGRLLITTPNVTSWKKLLMLSAGDWSYDSPTFGGEWGHRYEYSHYHLRRLLHRSGFAVVNDSTKDIYFDDPRGLRQAIQFLLIVLTKILTGNITQAAKMMLRSGSGLLFLAEKREHMAAFPDPDDLERI